MNFSIKTMLIPVTLATALSVLAGGAALADCASDVENVKAIIQDAGIADKDKAKVEEALKEALKKQTAKDEDGCTLAISAAKLILKID
jgi:hypothetical protein